MMKKLSKLALLAVAAAFLAALPACSSGSGGEGDSGTAGTGSGTNTTVTGTLNKNLDANKEVTYTAASAGTYIVISVDGGARVAGVSFGTESWKGTSTDGDTNQAGKDLFTGTKMTVSTGSGQIKYDVTTGGVINGTLKLDAAEANNAKDKCVKVKVTEGGTITFQLNASGSNKDYTIRPE